MDTFTKEIRSRNMSHIRSKDTSPELILRHYLFSKGLRYRINDKLLPGKPDIVLKRYKTAIFVHGCFWHCHEGCKYFVIPKSNQDYWIKKLNRNKERDQETFQKLKEMGWNIIIVWECELRRDKRERTLEKVYYEILFGSGPYEFDMENEYFMSKRIRKKVEDEIADDV